MQPLFAYLCALNLCHKNNCSLLGCLQNKFDFGYASSFSAVLHLECSFLHRLFSCKVIACCVAMHASLQLWDELTGQGKLLQDGVRAVEDGVKVVGDKIKVVEEEVRAGVRSFMEGVECFLSFTPAPVRVRSA